MITLLLGNPLVPTLDLSHLRLLSCGGSPQSAATIARAIATFGCEFFVSYGMTECCGKISMSILDTSWYEQLQQEREAAAGAAGAAEGVTEIERQTYERLLGQVCTSGRPFMMMEVSAEVERCSPGMCAVTGIQIMGQSALPLLKLFAYVQVARGSVIAPDRHVPRVYALNQE